MEVTKKILPFDTSSTMNHRFKFESRFGHFFERLLSDKTLGNWEDWRKNTHGGRNRNRRPNRKQHERTTARVPTPEIEEKFEILTIENFEGGFFGI